MLMIVNDIRVSSENVIQCDRAVISWTGTRVGLSPFIFYLFSMPRTLSTSIDLTHLPRLGRSSG